RRHDAFAKPGDRAAGRRASRAIRCLPLFCDHSLRSPGMKRIIPAAALALVVSAPAFADVTIKSTANSKGFGLSGVTTSVTYIQGLKMRVEATIGDKHITSIYD